MAPAATGMIKALKKQAAPSRKRTAKAVSSSPPPPTLLPLATDGPDEPDEPNTAAAPPTSGRKRGTASVTKLPRLQPPPPLPPPPPSPLQPDVGGPASPPPAATAAAAASTGAPKRKRAAAAASRQPPAFDAGGPAAPAAPAPAAAPPAPTHGIQGYQTKVQGVFLYVICALVTHCWQCFFFSLWRVRNGPRTPPFPSSLYTTCSTRWVNCFWRYPHYRQYQGRLPPLQHAHGPPSHPTRCRRPLKCSTSRTGSWTMRFPWPRLTPCSFALVHGQTSRLVSAYKHTSNIENMLKTPWQAAIFSA